MSSGISARDFSVILRVGVSLGVDEQDDGIAVNPEQLPQLFRLQDRQQQPVRDRAGLAGDHSPIRPGGLRVWSLFPDLCLAEKKNVMTLLIFASKLCIIQYGGENYDFNDFNAPGSIAEIRRSGR